MQWFAFKRRRNRSRRRSELGQRMIGIQWRYNDISDDNKSNTILHCL